LSHFLEPLLDFCNKYPPKNIVLTKPQGGRYPGVPLDSLSYLDWNRDDVQCHELPRDAIHSLASYDTEEVGLVVSLGSLYLQGNLLSVFGWGSDEDLSLYAKD
jgi:hypothetical protein